jgi:hypothetical protein
MTTADLSVVVRSDAVTVPLGPPTQLHQLTAGLLVFFARPSLLQTWAEFFGHQWRHVGLTVQTEAGLMVASYGPRKCFRLDDPFEIMGAYTRVGIARVFSNDAEIQAVQAFCRRFEHLERSDSPYTFSGIFVGPIHLMARRRAPGVIRTFLLVFVHLYCWLQGVRYRDRTAFGCSTFAWAAIDEVLDRPLRIPLSAHPDDEAAYATPSTRRDELFARWLCGPTELWDAISPRSRADLDLSNIGETPQENCRVDGFWIVEVASYIDQPRPGVRPLRALV